MTLPVFNRTGSGPTLGHTPNPSATTLVNAPNPNATTLGNAPNPNATNGAAESYEAL